MNIFVGSLPFRMEEAELKELFEAYGEVASARIITDKFSGRSRGFGFVEMGDEEAQQAIAALNQKEFNGKILSVSEAKPREEKPRRFDNNRGGGYGGGNKGGYGGGGNRGGNRW